MASVIGLVNRNRHAANPPVVPKGEKPLKFGILGAANIGPNALFTPAKTHPDVIVQAVAARNKAKATAYAAKHGIPEVKDSYQAIIDDPSIDCIYVPLPNGLHYEWTTKALRAGKHVLLEKPSVSNAVEAERLFLGAGMHADVPGAPSTVASTTPATAPHPVLLEAFHYRFHPAAHYFYTRLVRPELVARARATLEVPSFYFPKDDIRYFFALSGGAMTDLGAYTTHALRTIFAAEPDECVRADLTAADWTDEAKQELAKFKADGGKKVMGTAEGEEGRKLADRAFDVEWRFPNGGTGVMTGDLRGSAAPPTMPFVEVEHREEALDVTDAAVLKEAGLDGKKGAAAAKEGQRLGRVRKVTLNNFIMAVFWHRIDVEDTYMLRDAGGAELRRWTRKESRKVYTWADAGVAGKDDKPYWASYRHMLGAFVDRVRGRGGGPELEEKDAAGLEGVGIWIPPRDSVGQMHMIDRAYLKAGWAIRPTSKFE